MTKLKDFKIGDVIKITYTDKFYGLSGIVFGYNTEYPRTILENGEYTSWCIPTSLKHSTINLTTIEKLKTALVDVFNSKQVDNLTYIELLAKLNELSKQSKKSI
jgi:hypothetical protein